MQLRLWSIDDKAQEFHCPCCGGLHTLSFEKPDPPMFPLTLQLLCQRCLCHFTLQVDGLMPPREGEAMAVNRPSVRAVAEALDRNLRELDVAPAVAVPYPPRAPGSAPMAPPAPPPRPPRPPRGLLGRLADLLFGSQGGE